MSCDRFRGLAGTFTDSVLRRLGPNIVRVLPSTCVTFLVYENMKYSLPRMWNDGHEDESAVTNEPQE